MIEFPIMPFSVNFLVELYNFGSCSCEQLHFPNQIETCDCGCEYLIFIRSRSFEPQVASPPFLVQLAVVVGDFHIHKSKQSLTQVILDGHK